MRIKVGFFQDMPYIWIAQKACDMFRFILYLLGTSAMVFSISLAIRHGLKGAFAWDRKISRRLNSTYLGFRRHIRIPFAVGVIPEFFYFLVLGRNNYFNARWWALRTASYISFLFFLAALFRQSLVRAYYSGALWAEDGFTTVIQNNTGALYLSMVNALFGILLVLILVESIRMHKGWAPMRFIFYSVLSAMMALVSVAVLALIIAISFLYLAYKIIMFFLSSRRSRTVENDDGEGAREKLNNAYRRFRAELYAWEKNRKQERKVEEKTETERPKPVIKRTRRRIEPKPKEKNNHGNIPRIHPD